MTLTIRNISAGDQPDWTNLWRLYLEYYQTSVSNEVYQKTFERLIDSNRP